MEETQRTYAVETIEEQQTKYSVLDTQLPLLSPLHDTSTPIDTIIVKDVLDNFGQNINPLTAEDLKKILDQTTLQAQLCNNPVLVSVEELQKVVADLTRDKVNPQEPPFDIPSATSGKPIEKTIVDTSTKVDSTTKVLMIEHKTKSTKEKEPAKEKTR